MNALPLPSRTVRLGPDAEIRVDASEDGAHPGLARVTMRLWRRPAVEMAWQPMAGEIELSAGEADRLADALKFLAARVAEAAVWS